MSNAPWNWLSVGVVALACVGTAAACATQAVDQPDAAPVEYDAGYQAEAAPPTCKDTQTLCGSFCTNVQTDPSNCGKCTNNCGAKKFCSAGACKDSCEPPTMLCNGLCIDFATDHDNCSKCGFACGSDQFCNKGVCQKQCQPGQTLCGGTDCSNLRSDPNHCGDCGTACDTSSGEACLDGLCCKPGELNCGGKCTSVAYDNNNCGTCGFACGGPTPYCVGSSCATCNPSVLLLTDQTSSSDITSLAAALAAAGMPTTQGKLTSYDGTTKANTFGAVLLDTYSSFSSMTASGQTSISNAYSAGTGIALLDYYFLYYNWCCSYNTTIAPLFPATNTASIYFSYEQHVLTKSGATADANFIWTGVTTPHTESFYAGYEYGLTAKSSTTTVATISDSSYGTQPAIVVQDAAGGKGRSVAVNAPVVYSGWSSDSTNMALVVNAMKWATGCF